MTVILLCHTVTGYSLANQDHRLVLQTYLAYTVGQGYV